MLKAQRIEEALKRFSKVKGDIVNDSEAHKGHAGYTDERHISKCQ